MDEIRVETTIYSLASAPPPPQDHREGERHITLLRVGSLMIGDRRELCLIRNISAGGMLIRAYCPIAPGTRVSIELKCGQSAGGTACWTDGHSVGVAFDQPIDVIDLLSGSAEGSRPRMPRIEIGCGATVRQEADVHRGRAINISQGGVGVSTDGILTVGSAVTVTLPGLAPQPATVRWNDGGCYGITFNRLLPLSLLVEWLREQRTRLMPACGSLAP